MAWSCDGRRLASGSFDRTVSIFVLEKDRLVSTFSIPAFTNRSVFLLFCFEVYNRFADLIIFFPDERNKP